MFSSYLYCWSRSCGYLVAVAVLATANAAAQVVQSAESDPPRRWVAWDASDIKSITTATGNQEKSTSNLLDGKEGSASLNDKLQGSITTIEFNKPHRIGQLAFVQGGAHSWSQPKVLRVKADGREVGVINLSNERGKIQSVPFDQTIKTLDITVEDTYGEGKMPWGGFAGIGDALFGPAIWPLVEKPLQPGQRTLDLVIDTPVRAPVQVSLNAEKMSFVAKPMMLESGRHTYRVSLDDLVPDPDYGFHPEPQHFDELVVSGENGEIPVRLISVTPTTVDQSGDGWKPLPQMEFDVKVIDGEQWTQGHSYKTAGRFGNSTYNGLLTELVGDSWFRAYTARAEDIGRRQDFDLIMEGLSGSEAGRTDEAWKVKVREWDSSKESIDVNWTTMVLTKFGKDSEAIRYTAGLLVPGFLVDANRPLKLSSRGGGQLPIRSGAPDEEEGRFQVLPSKGGEEGIRRIGPSAVLTSQGLLVQPQELRNLREPWLIAIWGIEDAEPTFWGDTAVAVLITGDAREPIQWDSNGLSLPAGRWGVSTAFYGLLNKGWSADTLAERGRLLAGLLRTYPVACEEYYRVVDNAVKIRNEFSYERWGNPRWQVADYAPIPPIYSWGHDSVGLEGVPHGISHDISTPFGPYRWVSGNVLEYELPHSPSAHMAAPYRAEFNEYYESMQKEFADALRKPPYERYTNHPWIMGYFKGWSQAILGGSYLDRATLDSLLEIARPRVERMYAPSSWVYRNELFTGTPYYIRGWIDRSTRPAMFGDPNSNVGQAAYSLYSYAKYSGDWDLVRSLWPRVMDTVRVFEVLNDWAVPETTSREAVKYGAIDMDTVAYAGISAMERMAIVLGEKNDADRIAYLRAKIGGATALRLNIAHYLDPQRKSPELYGVGFGEDGPALERARLRYGGGLDHVAMCFAWTGEVPEVYDFLIEYLGPDFLTDFQRNFMDMQFADWRQMPFNRVRSGAHIALRARLPGWSKDEVAEDIAIWLKHDKKVYPGYHSAGMLGAYSTMDTGVYLVNWEPARFESSSYDKGNRVLEANLVNEAPFVFEFVSPDSIDHVSIDGNRIEDDRISKARDGYRIELPHGGKIRVQLTES